MKRIRVKPTNKLMKFTYQCGCVIFVTMDMVDRLPPHYHPDYGKVEKAK